MEWADYDSSYPKRLGQKFENGEAVLTLFWIEYVPGGLPGLSHIILLTFTLLGLALVPGRLGNGCWALLAWFAGISFWVLAMPATLSPLENPWIFLAFGQLPLVFFVLDLAFSGKATLAIRQTPLRDFLEWSVYRLMGTHYAFALFGASIPPQFGLETAFGESFTAMGALVLWLAYKPGQRWFTMAILFWNAYGLSSAMAINIRLIMAQPLSFLDSMPRDISRYSTEFPQVWMTLFWLPISIGIHLTIFYKLYAERALEQGSSDTGD
jgi:hypothetical protein